MIGSVCVFCGSNKGTGPGYLAAAEAMGAEIARRGMKLVYGGGNVGTMGALARAALAGGGEVLGVIPRRLHEITENLELTELVVAEGMHERKARMAAESDAFVALPGGIGTLEEFFEVWAWRQIGYHAKPVGILDVAGFYRPLLGFLAGVEAEGFLRRGEIDELVVEADPARLIERLEAKKPPRSTKAPERRA
ncbi:MAG: TIGR00730 family Rossman fold protein [Spirochaetaceae bacterium]|nr:TIGR00730 family Rossman fold protein [Spirochaetaceae bacterium]